MITAVKRLAALLIAVAGLPLVVPGPSAQAVFPPCPRYLSIADYTGYEGTLASAGGTIFVFTITSSGCASPGQVDYSTMDGPASTDDFTPASGTLSFPFGDMSPRTITVLVTPDALRESPEDFRVDICRPTSAIQITQETAFGTILNDDPLGILHEPGHWHHGFRCSE